MCWINLTNRVVLSVPSHQPVLHTMLILAQHLHLLTEILHALLDLLCHISHEIHGQKITWENPEVGWRARLTQVGTYIDHFNKVN